MRKVWLVLAGVTILGLIGGLVGYLWSGDYARVDI